MNPSKSRGQSLNPTTAPAKKIKPPCAPRVEHGDFEVPWSHVLILNIRFVWELAIVMTGQASATVRTNVEWWANSFPQAMVPATIGLDSS